jgi:hypothetical protein
VFVLLILQIKKQKAVQPIATSQFQATTTTGLVAPTTALIAGDRGCLPGIAPAQVPTQQTTSAQLLRAQLAGTTVTGALADYTATTTLLCSTSGLCCITDLCNTMSRIEMNFVAMFMSIALALIGVLNGF